MMILCDNNFASNIGKEFQVNSYTTGAQLHSCVEKIQNDTFIVVWDSSYSDGSAAGISGQLFYNDGTKKGSEFQINSYTIGDQLHPHVESLQNGIFIVVWDSSYSDGSAAGISGQLFYSDGTKKGNEFQINSYTTGDQSNPYVKYLQDNTFIVVWESSYSDGSAAGISGQLFYNDGTKRGNEFQINSYTIGDQLNPDVKYLQDNAFIVVWDSSYSDGSAAGISGQLFYNDGTKKGSEFQINSYTIGNQFHPRVENLMNDIFMVVWDSAFSDGSDAGIAGQLFYQNGTKLGSEFQINSYTTGPQQNPDVKYLQDDRFIVVWDSSLSDGSDSGIAAKIFDSSCINDFLVTTTAPTTTLLPSTSAPTTTRIPTTMTSVPTTTKIPTTMTSMPSTTITTNIPSTETLDTTTTTSYTRIPTIETPATSITSEASGMEVDYNIMLAVGTILFLYLE